MAHSVSRFCLPDHARRDCCCCTSCGFCRLLTDLDPVDQEEVDRRCFPVVTDAAVTLMVVRARPRLIAITRDSCASHGPADAPSRRRRHAIRRHTSTFLHSRMGAVCAVATAGRGLYGRRTAAAVSHRCA
jgi:hypothetical protein